MRTLLLIAAAGSAVYAQTACEQLQSLKLPDTTITMVTTVPAGAFVNPAPPRLPSPTRSATGCAAGRPRWCSADTTDAAGVLPRAGHAQTVG
jgi:hypothetical protein